jgi:hypothetical protein
MASVYVFEGFPQAGRHCARRSTRQSVASGLGWPYTRVMRLVSLLPLGLCGALAACSLLANYDDFTPSASQRADAMAADARAADDADALGRWGSLGNAQCGDLNTICDGFERVSYPSALWTSDSIQAPSTLAIIAPVAPAAAEGTRALEFKAAAGTVAKPAKTYLSAYEPAQAVHVRARVLIKEAPPPGILVRIMNLESRVPATGKANSYVVVDLSAESTLLSQVRLDDQERFVETKSGPVLKTWPVGKWVTFELSVDLAGRKARLKLEGESTELFLKNTIPGAQYILPGLSGFDPPISPPYTVLMDDMLLQLVRP